MLAPMAITIRRDSDPFRKYWWVILLAFGLIGGWVCLPLIDYQSGSGAPALESGLKSADQSLDAINNPNGAPGFATNLSMDSGAYAKKNLEGPVTSSLYQPPPEAAAAGAPLAASDSNLANALKDVSKKDSLASASFLR